MSSESIYLLSHYTLNMKYFILISKVQNKKERIGKIQFNLQKHETNKEEDIHT